MRKRLITVILAVLSLAAGPLPGGPPAHAYGASDMQFAVGGTLPTFPCPAGCTTGFNGAGTGAGHLVKLVGDDVYDASFTLLGAAVGGSASYVEPEFPFCPAVGSAQGTVTLGSGPNSTITGIIRSTAFPTGGTITGVDMAFTFAYDRVGPTAVARILSGSLTVSYTFPGPVTGSFTENFIPVVPGNAGTGVGAAVFEVDAQEAARHCGILGTENDGLDFTLEGEAAVATS